MKNNNNQNQIKSNIKKEKTGRALLLALVFVFAFMALVTTDTVRANAALAGETESTDAVVQTSGVEAGAYEVTSYIVRATVQKDHSYNVTETIGVNIPDQLQSIEFAIPSGNFRVSDVMVDNSSYNTGNSQTASKVSITDPDKLSTGTHEYTISYRIREYQDKDQTRDIFYCYALLPEWKQPIGEVDIEFSFPEDFPFDDMQCYAGQFGVQDSANKIKFTKKDGDKVVRVTGSLIPENYGIALKAQLPEGYWKGALSGRVAYMSIIMSLAVAVIILTILWLIGGKDPKVKRQKCTKPIEGFSPVELGYAYNNHVSTSDIVRMLLEYAIKGYLRISEYEPKKYRIYREEDPNEEEKMYRNAYNILFEDVFKGRAIEMDELIPRLYLIKRSIRDDVAAGFATPDSSPFTPISRIFRYVGAGVFGIGLAVANALSYVYAHQTINFVESLLMGFVAAGSAWLLCQAIDARDSSPSATSKFYEVFAGVLSAIPVVYVAVVVTRNTLDPIPAFAVVTASAVSYFLIVIMRARGTDNAKLVSALRQLRNFIYHPTPKELLENHLADPNYYYEMMIYALAVGAEESWAISFLTLEVEDPKWFTNEIEGEAFANLNFKKETVDYARDIKSFVRTVENAYNDMKRRNKR